MQRSLDISSRQARRTHPAEPSRRAAFCTGPPSSPAHADRCHPRDPRMRPVPIRQFASAAELGQIEVSLETAQADGKLALCVDLAWQLRQVDCARARNLCAQARQLISTGPNDSLALHDTRPLVPGRRRGCIAARRRRPGPRLVRRGPCRLRTLWRRARQRRCGLVERLDTLRAGPPGRVGPGHGPRRRELSPHRRRDAPEGSAGTKLDPGRLRRRPGGRPRNGR